MVNFSEFPLFKPRTPWESLLAIIISVAALDFYTHAIHSISVFNLSFFDIIKKDFARLLFFFSLIAIFVAISGYIIMRLSTSLLIIVVGIPLRLISLLPNSIVLYSEVPIDLLRNYKNKFQYSGSEYRLGITKKSIEKERFYYRISAYFTALITIETMRAITIGREAGYTSVSSFIDILPNNGVRTFMLNNFDINESGNLLFGAVSLSVCFILRCSVSLFVSQTNFLFINRRGETLRAEREDLIFFINQVKNHTGKKTKRDKTPMITIE